MAGPRFSAKFEGVGRLRRRLRARKEAYVPAVRGALFEEAEATMTEAKRLTPVDEGVLRSSGHVQIVDATPPGIAVEAGFGGPAGSGNLGESNREDVGYAVPVHEDLLARHTVGQAKYLEVPFRRRLPAFSRRLAARVRARLRGR